MSKEKSGSAMLSSTIVYPPNGSLSPSDPADGYPDFFPWEANTTAEDLLSATNIQTGFVDRPAVANESASSKTILHPVLKQTHSLENLSTFVLTALEKRYERGSMRNPSSFKPPPRVTLTDQKRETWLKDLANPAVPLRRLSRTVPHGIRGRMLLDHCLSKMVPHSRAVWFVRCVGANEIRGLRRKGSSSRAPEYKWIRDWTTNVTEFMFSAISGSTIQERDGADRLRYIIRFVAYIWGENLLCREHFLQTCLAAFSVAELENWGFHLFLWRIFKEEFLASPRLAKKYVLELCKKLAEIQSSRKEASDDFLYNSIMELIEHAITHNSAAFVNVLAGEYVSIGLKALQEKPSPLLAELVETVRTRTKALLSWSSWKASPLLHQELRLSFLELLDATVSPCSYEWLFEEGIRLSKSSEDFVDQACKWATTRYRTGCYRVFIALGVLKEAALTFEIQPAVFDYYETMPHNVDLDAALLLFQELVEQKLISIPEFIRRMISHGSLSGHSKASRHLIDVLRDLSVRTLHPTAGKMLQMCLRSSGAVIVNEQLMLSELRTGLVSYIPFLDNQPVSTAPGAYPSFLEGLDRSLCGILPWLRERIAHRFGHYLHPGKDTQLIGGEELAVLHRVLERLRDYRSLSQTLECTLQTAQGFDVLNESLNILSIHTDIWEAMGLLQPLLWSLLGRTGHITNEVDRHCLLFRIQGVLRCRVYLPASLQNDVQQRLSSCAQNSAKQFVPTATMQSPLSENSPDGLLDLDIVDQIGKELRKEYVPGTVLDANFVSRFLEIIRYLASCESPGRKDFEKLRLACQVVGKLRQTFSDEATAQYSAWAKDCIVAFTRGTLTIHGLLVACASNCLRLADLAHSLLPLLDNATPEEQVFLACKDFLTLPFTDAVPRLKQVLTFQYNELLISDPKSVLTLLRVFVLGNRFEEESSELLYSHLYGTLSHCMQTSFSLYKSVFFDPVFTSGESGKRFLQLYLDSLADDGAADLIANDSEELKKIMRLAAPLSKHNCQCRALLFFDARKSIMKELSVLTVQCAIDVGLSRCGVVFALLEDGWKEAVFNFSCRFANLKILFAAQREFLDSDIINTEDSRLAVIYEIIQSCCDVKPSDISVEEVEKILSQWNRLTSLINSIYQQDSSSAYGRLDRCLSVKTKLAMLVKITFLAVLQLVDQEGRLAELESLCDPIVAFAQHCYIRASPEISACLCDNLFEIADCMRKALFSNICADLSVTDNRKLASFVAGIFGSAEDDLFSTLTERGAPIPDPLIKAWEIIEEPAPSMTDNDIPWGMAHFDGRKHPPRKDIWRTLRSEDLFDAEQRKRAVRGFDDGAARL